MNNLQSDYLTHTINLSKVECEKDAPISSTVSYTLHFTLQFTLMPEMLFLRCFKVCHRTQYTQSAKPL